MKVMALLSNKIVSNSADAFNLKKARTVDSEYITGYNCGGYALETYNWFLPFFNGDNFSPYMWRQVCEYNHWDYEHDCLENGTTEGEIIFADYEDEITHLLVEEILTNSQNDNIDEDYAYDLAEKIFWNGEYNHPAAITLAVKLMIYNFNLRVINNFDELEDDEYGIAFATQVEHGCDFHFFKYCDGVFSHKMGNDFVENFDVLPTLDNISNLFLRMGYDSDVYLFAKKKQ